jgi:hypothetical protein
MSDENVAKVGKQLALFPLPETRPLSARPATFLASVDQIISKLWSLKEWRQYVDALSNRTSVTGKWEVDRGFAAKRVQEEATKANLTEVATAKLSKIMRAIETILRRDHLGRRQRLAALNVQSAE